LLKSQASGDARSVARKSSRTLRQQVFVLFQSVDLSAIRESQAEERIDQSPSETGKRKLSGLINNPRMDVEGWRLLRLSQMHPWVTSQ
jgi:hypothetical protein